LKEHASNVLSLQLSKSEITRLSGSPPPKPVWPWHDLRGSLKL